MAALTLEGFPPDIAFHPHGMHFRRETAEMFVINHAYSEGGERIDVFKVGFTVPGGRHTAQHIFSSQAVRVGWRTTTLEASG